MVRFDYCMSLYAEFAFQCVVLALIIAFVSLRKVHDLVSNWCTMVILLDFFSELARLFCKTMLVQKNELSDCYYVRIISRFRCTIIYTILGSIFGNWSVFHFSFTVHTAVKLTRCTIGAYAHSRICNLVFLSNPYDSVIVL